MGQVNLCVETIIFLVRERGECGGGGRGRGGRALGRIDVGVCYTRGASLYVRPSFRDGMTLKSRDRKIFVTALRPTSSIPYSCCMDYDTVDAEIVQVTPPLGVWDYLRLSTKNQISTLYVRVLPYLS